MTASTQADFTPLKLMVPGFVSWVHLALEGARTNVFGWGCPLYWTQPSLSILASSSSLVSSSALPCVSWPFGLFGLRLAIWLPHLLLLLRAPSPGIQGTRRQPSTCMSFWFDDAKDIELACKLGALHITVRGPPELAANFIKDISSRGLSSTSSLRHLPSVRGLFWFGFRGWCSCSACSCPWDKGPDCSNFDPCPQLGGSSTSGPERVKRAWLAGQ